MPDGNRLWYAQGVTHRITVLESGVQGNAVIYVKSFSGEGSGTLSPEERLSLARALYPAAFEGQTFVPERWMYTVFRNGKQRGSVFRHPHLARLTMLPTDVLMKQRPASDWEPADDTEGVQW